MLINIPPRVNLPSSYAQVTHTVRPTSGCGQSPEKKENSHEKRGSQGEMSVDVQN
jgi:hypothetical protein